MKTGYVRSRHSMAWGVPVAATAFLLAACGSPDLAEPEPAPSEPAAGAEPQGGTVGQKSQSLHFEGACTQEQQFGLAAAHSWGVYPMILDAIAALDRFSEPRLFAYFGPHITWERFDIDVRFRYLKHLFEATDITYLCYEGQFGDCASPSTKARASAASRAIYICPSFWELDHDWKMHVLTHEAAHLADTRDYVFYDENGNEIPFSPTLVAQILAASDPNSASRNAENYALYMLNQSQVW